MHSSVDSLEEDEDEGSPVPSPADTLTTLNNYFSLNALDKNSDASSDSMETRLHHHHARQDSLAATIDSCEVISALQSVKQKITPYIGNAEKWEPPDFDLTPDHGDILKPKLFRRKRRSKKNTITKSMYNNKVSDIGTVHGFKAPKYFQTESTPTKENETFLDRDKRWYHKPNKAKKPKSQPQHRYKSQSVDINKKKIKKKPQRMAKSARTNKEMTFDEEKETNEPPKSKYTKQRKRVRKSQKSRMSRCFLKDKDKILMESKENETPPPQQNDPTNDINIAQIDQYSPSLVLIDYDDDDDEDSMLDVNMSPVGNIGALFNNSKFAKKDKKVTLTQLNASSSVEFPGECIKIRPRTKRSQSLLSASSDATQKLKQQNDSKLKLEAIHSANEYVEHKETNKNTKKKNKNKNKKKKSTYAGTYQRKTKKKGKKKGKKNKCWKQHFQRTSTM